MRAGAWAVVVGLIVTMAQPAWATMGGEQPPDAFDQRMSKSPIYLAMQKLGRGLANMVGSPLEIPLAIEQQYHRSNDSAAGFVTGTLYGAFKTVVRFAVGGIETLTFFCPCTDQHCTPMLPPIGYFQKQPGAG